MSSRLSEQIAGGAAALILLLGGAALSAERTVLNDSWPRQITTAKGHTLVVYQPQIETFQQDAVTGRAAVAFTKAGETAQRFGVVFFSAHVSVDRDSRTVSIRDVSVHRVRFPNSTAENEQKLAKALEDEIPRWNLVVSYDRLLENLKVAERERANAEGLKHEPPTILFAEKPTVLVTFDGEPRMRVVQGTPFERAVNSPFVVLRDTRSHRFFLAGGSNWWYEASEPRGPWKPIAVPPADVAEFVLRGGAGSTPPVDSLFGDDGTKLASPPAVLVATTPTELIVSEGKPSFAPVGGIDLLRMANTESNVFLSLASQEYFVLLSGRWFRSRALTGGAWTYVSASGLPAAFSKIPPDSEAGSVLASVAGTDEAAEALLDAQLPQVAAIKRSEASLAVEYDGEPRFEAIAGTDVEYAENASTEVLRIRGRYYACDNAVWYAADSPRGPWFVADSIPREDIDAIPPSAPVYNVKYAKIYDATPETVDVGYTPEYLGSYPSDDGTMVWGTGWYYPPWNSDAGFWSPWLWPWPWTWGFGACYDPWYGWGFGSSWCYPFYGAGYGWGGHHGGHHDRWWGPGGYHPPAHVHDRSAPWRKRPQSAGSAPAHSGFSGRGGESPGQPRLGFRPGSGLQDSKLFQQNLYNRLPSRSLEHPGSTSRPAPRPVLHRPNNVYAGPNGNVYRRTDDGRWQQRGGSGWRQMPSAGATPRSISTPGSGMAGRVSPGSGLNRDFGARQRGEIRARQFNSRPAAPSSPRHR